MKKLIIITIAFINSISFSQTGTDCSTAILVSSSGCSAAAAYTNAGITGTLSPLSSQ